LDLELPMMYFTGNSKLHLLVEFSEHNRGHIMKIFANLEKLRQKSDWLMISKTFWVMAFYLGVVANLSAQVPTVVSTLPAKNALAVALTDPITVTFSSDMDAATIDKTSMVIIGNYQGIIAGTYSTVGAITTFTPTSPYLVGEKINVTLTTAVQASGGAAQASAFSWEFMAKVKGGYGTFGSRATYEIGGGYQAQALYTSDLDNDGDIDLAAVNGGYDNVSILLNNGDGTYAASTEYEVGDDPRSVFISDLDGDGNNDLAVANYYGDSVSVLLNTGDGTFTPKVSYFIDGLPSSVIASDIDGDGDNDILVANATGGDISVLLNNGDGTFASKIDYDGGSFPRSVVASDIDNDGDIDLAVADYYFAIVLLNNGDGTFADTTRYEAGAGTIALTAYDADGDGYQDLAVVNSADHNVSVLINNGDGTYGTSTNYSTGDDPRAIFAADLDGDGDFDLAVSSDDDSGISVLLNNGDATYATQSTYYIGYRSHSVFACDVNGNGFNDLVSVNYGDRNISVLLNVKPGPELVTSANSVEFDAAVINSYNIKNLKVYNLGGVNTLKVDSITCTNAVFSAYANSFEIYAGDSLEIEIIFRPVTMDSSGGTLILHSNDTVNPEYLVEVSGKWLNSEPLAYQDNFTISEDEEAVFNLVLNDTDIDDQDLFISEIIESGHANITIHTDTTVMYVPEENWSGMTIFKYAVADGGGGFDTSSVIVTITAVNDPPMITSSATDTATEGESFSYTITAVDVEGDNITLGAKNIPDWLSADGSSLVGTPQKNDSTSLVRVWAADASLDTSFLDVTITVKWLNTAPIITSLDSVNATEDIYFKYLATATDSEDSTLTFVFDQMPSWLSAANDTAFGTPLEAATDTSFRVITSDGKLTDTLTVVLTVIPVNDPPESFALLFPESETTVLDPDSILLTFSWEPAIDIDGDEIIYSLFFETDDWDSSISDIDTTSYRFNIEEFPRGVDILWSTVAFDFDTSTASLDTNFINIHETVEVDEFVNLPTEYTLEQNYPNPFNPTTTISYSIPEETEVVLQVYDIGGSLVASLESGTKPAGWHKNVWNGVDDRGRPVSTGIYLATLQTGSYTRTIKMLYLK
jgi:hypothetical protein